MRACCMRSESISNSFVLAPFFKANFINFDKLFFFFNSFFLFFLGLLSIVVSGLGRLEIGCVRVVTATNCYVHFNYDL